MNLLRDQGANDEAGDMQSNVTADMQSSVTADMQSKLAANITDLAKAPLFVVSEFVTGSRSKYNRW